MRGYRSRNDSETAASAKHPSVGDTSGKLETWSILYGLQMGWAYPALVWAAQPVWASFSCPCCKRILEESAQFQGLLNLLNYLFPAGWDVSSRAVVLNPLML